MVYKLTFDNQIKYVNLGFYITSGGEPNLSMAERDKVKPKNSISELDPQPTGSQLPIFIAK